MNPNTATLCLLVLVGAAAAADAAASCKPVIDALDLADKQPRSAYFSVENATQAPSGPADTITIGKTTWINNHDGTYDKVDEADATETMAAALKKTERQGKAKCAALGVAKYRGKDVNKFQFDNPQPDMPAGFRKTILWVERDSGLPVYQEVPAAGPGGYAIVYGDAVKAPAPGKGKK